MNIVLTGITAGVGHELLQQLLKDGHTVWGISRSLPTESYTGNYRFTKVDLGNANDVSSFLEDMHSVGFLPDVIIYNAAIYDDGNDINTLDFFDKINAINTRSAIQIAENFISYNNILHVYISSISAKVADWDNVFYHTSKLATTQYFDYLRIVKQRHVKLFYFGAIDTGIKKNKLLKNISKRVNPKSVAALIVKNITTSQIVFYYPWYYRLIAIFFNLFSNKSQYILYKSIKK